MGNLSSRKMKFSPQKDEIHRMVTQKASFLGVQQIGLATSTYGISWMMKGQSLVCEEYSLINET